MKVRNMDDGRRALPRRGGASAGSVLVAVLVAIGLLAGCGGEPEAPPAAGTDPVVGTVTIAPDGVQEVTIDTPDEFVFLPEQITVAPGQVRITVRNTGEEMVHNFLFTDGSGPEDIDAEIPILYPGESDTIEFEVTAPGDYQYECSFHVQVGQVGTMTVTG